jgi:Pyridoxamine 5'-phosphate oxidase
MSRRDAIRMDDAELAAFTEESRVLTCATIGPNARPHLMPLWFCVRDGLIASWTYASSQKARNLERLPQATVQLEAGDSYEMLRGVMHECDVELLRDTETIASVGLDLALRYAPGDMTAEQAPAELRAFVAAQAAKRVALVFHPTRTVTWDHRKLGGTY